MLGKILLLGFQPIIGEWKACMENMKILSRESDEDISDDNAFVYNGENNKIFQATKFSKQSFFRKWIARFVFNPVFEIKQLLVISFKLIAIISFIKIV